MGHINKKIRDNFLKIFIHSLYSMKRNFIGSFFIISTLLFSGCSSSWNTTPSSIKSDLAYNIVNDYGDEILIATAVVIIAPVAIASKILGDEEKKYKNYSGKLIEAETKENCLSKNGEPSWDFEKDVFI